MIYNLGARLFICVHVSNRHKTSDVAWTLLEVARMLQIRGGKRDNSSRDNFTCML